jgi:hypothetical protein
LFSILNRFNIVRNVGPLSKKMMAVTI